MKKEYENNPQEVVQAVCRHFGVRREELARQTTPAAVRAARAACALLALPAGLRMRKMGRLIGCRPKSLFLLRRRYWKSFHIDTREFRTLFDELGRELGLPVEDSQAMGVALGFHQEVIFQKEILDQICVVFGVDREELRWDFWDPNVRHAQAAWALIVARCLLPTVMPFFCRSDLPTLLELGLCLLEAAKGREPSGYSKSFREGYQQVCRGLRLDPEEPDEYAIEWVLGRDFCEM